MATVWHDLLFIRWPVDPQLRRSRIPDGLTLDTYEGQAWIGMVPFRMSGIWYRLFPSLAGLSDFSELNVRTYVTCAKQSPDVWFFSLDAAHKLVVHVARKTVYLPYFEARMSIQQADGPFP